MPLSLPLRASYLLSKERLPKYALISNLNSDRYALISNLSSDRTHYTYVEDFKCKTVFIKLNFYQILLIVACRFLSILSTMSICINTMKTTNIFVRIFVLELCY